MTRLVSFIAFAITAALVYDLVWGDGAERERATAVMRRTLELGETGLGALSDELGRLRRGEYDDALSTLSERLQREERPEDAAGWQQSYSEWLVKREDPTIPETELAEHAARLHRTGQDLTTD